MLSVFPELLNYSLLAPFLLRVVVGLIFIDLGALIFRTEKERWVASFETIGLRPTSFFVPLYGAIQIAGGTLLLIGLWTQVAALVFALITLMELYVELRAREVLKRDLVFYLLLFTISVSLLLTGPGGYAFDLPL